MNVREESERRDDAECGIPLAQWVCFCNSGNYAAIKQTDFPGQNFYVEPFGDNFQSVFPSPLSEFAQLHTDVRDAITYMREVVGPQINPISV